MAELDVIIVAYESSGYIEKCISGVINNFTNCKLRFIVVNNSPEDIKMREILNNYKENIILITEENIGFAKANNKASKLCKSEFIMLLNPDTIVEENFADVILKHIETTDNSGVCAPMLVYENGSYQNSSGFKYGIFHDFAESFALMPLYRLIQRLHFRFTQKKHVQVGWLSAACCILKKSIYDQANGFDEKMFLNYEDLDFCRRVTELGYKNLYFPGVKCIHSDHRSFKSDFAKLIYTRYQSKMYLSKKYFGSVFRLFSEFTNIIGLAVRYLYCAAFNREDSSQSALTGYKMALKLYWYGS